IEREDYAKLQTYLPEETEKRIQKHYTQQARWEIKRYRKITLDDTLQDLIEAQQTLNKEVQQHYQTTLQQGTSTETSTKRHKKVEQWCDEKDWDALRNHYKETFEGAGRPPLPKPQRALIEERLETLYAFIPSKRKTAQQLEQKNQIKGLFARAHLEAHQHQARIEARKTLEKNKAVTGQRKQLEQKLKENNGTLEFDKERLRYTTHLDNMSRTKTGAARFEHITLKETLFGKPLLTDHNDFLRMHKAFYDIEKPWFDTPLEAISWCGTLLEKNKELQRYLDTDKDIPEREVNNYQAVKQQYEHEIVETIASRLANHYLHFIYNAGYEGRQFREHGGFKVAGKQPRKKATAPTKKRGTEEEQARRKRNADSFMTRWQISEWEEIIDWMRHAKIAKPHLPNHRLETNANDQAARAGTPPFFKKITSYDKMPKQDGAGRLLDIFHQLDKPLQARVLKEVGVLARYTTEDVEGMYDYFYLPPTIEDFMDLVDVANTFGVSLSQASNNANTVRQFHEETFFEKHGRFLDNSYFREEHRSQIQRFKNNYTRLKKRTFKETGLEAQPRRGRITGVDQYYFSPELILSKLLTHHYNGLDGFVERTLETKDSRRRMARMQYLRSFMIPVLADYTELRKAKKDLEGEARDKATYTRGNPDQAAMKDLVTPLLQHERANKDPGKTYMRLVDYDFQNIIEQARRIDTTGAKTFIKKCNAWRRKKRFFERLYRTRPEYLEDLLIKTFTEASTLINKSAATPIHVEGKFLYLKGAIDEQAAAERGLFKIQEDMDILAMGEKGITYEKHGQHKGYKADRGVGTYHHSHYQIATENALLKHAHKEEPRKALETLAYSARRLNNLYNIDFDNKKDREFARSFLQHNRSGQYYVGVQGREEKKFSEHGKKRFRPDPGYYQETYHQKLFGITTRRGKKAVDLNASFPKIVHSIVPLDHPEAADAYHKLVTSTSKKEQERHIDSILNPSQQRLFPI
ncbi:hypothetical protein GF367_03290, partial [Candidatus Woesearchaeota archaeon]|nr:hypothetical protein [Candidatus Woesearchaeota archaeon]